eukprot:CAMPEP_0115600874 /NCGR_PEP_ID=MMETSP0272-20121206/15111_1 /TAXON_ID=71861 /ORGANISM="Scrippsiella trochoidea, Strain CCMP3099" /LENGTH=68 /DNA_ID=CAMNT_0003036327 /DNA_START=30 /DNA_END=232 /DNA_ORIENTATION=-
MTSAERTPTTAGGGPGPSPEGSEARGQADQQQLQSPRGSSNSGLGGGTVSSHTLNKFETSSSLQSWDL